MRRQWRIPPILAFGVATAFAFTMVGTVLHRLLLEAIASTAGPVAGESAVELARQQSRMGWLLIAALVLLWLASLRTMEVTSGRIQERAQISEHAAQHDALTHLPNRVLLSDRAEQAVELARRRGTRVALMLLDLDGFKDINDTLGHHIGDELLIEVGRRLNAQLRTADTVARLGGDEFAVLLPEVEDTKGPERAAAALLEAFQERFQVAGLQLDVGVSIGVAMFPDHADSVEELMQRADVAMYDAKRVGRTYETYAVSNDPSNTDRLVLLGELRKAMADGDLVVHYQPKVNLHTGTVSSVEALVRWKHPQRGLLPPSDFIPLAESAGLTHQLTQYVLRIALAQFALWRAEGIEIDMAVNISARDLHDLDFPRRVAEVLNSMAIEPRSLELELTETSLMVDPKRALTVLNQLASTGVRLAIDDFGTGYSSLSYLKQLPVSTIKIDRSFVSDMATDTNDEVIVRSTIGLAHSLGLDVVAEGIEDEAAWRQLVADGCLIGQGFQIAKPMDVPEATEWVRWAQNRPPLRFLFGSDGPQLVPGDAEEAASVTTAVPERSSQSA